MSPKTAASMTPAPATTSSASILLRPTRYPASTQARRVAKSTVLRSVNATTMSHS